MDIENCLLGYNNEEVLEVHFQGKYHWWNITAHTKPRKNRKFYVSFYFDGFRYWADHVSLGMPFTAHKTKDCQPSYDYQVEQVMGYGQTLAGMQATGGAQQRRLDRIAHSKRNKQAKSLY